MKNLLVLLISFVAMTSISLSQELSQDQKEISALLDGLHDAAKNADKEKYLGSFAKGAVYMGTDEWERWPIKPDFTDYVGMRFDNGGWSYHSEDRNIYISPDGAFGWFDEIMISNSSGNRFRGSGVVVKEDGGWKFKQYIQSFMIYNEIWDDVINLMAEETKKKNN
ncbi:nuclear transport factor 2 family protein [Pseudemcibacter aquimaris]|uniref:nuclear transport factor 2 family protein n=1 Tax=Pseudemcibacter aquimaris TaxID=2857064 RepID=UPI002012482B|nr:nuclear transport factor 2 family protein [Pseudemcibacter aquimaris]MCC3862083.1 nuclear transport factor 2 family protein [Pseudemcibacter aquimaris]WDU58836.1 nuclear transport factor 2 family protein [Pseudemcibacter aquimaris]